MSLPTPIFDAPGATQFNGRRGDVIELPHDAVYEVAEGTIAFAFNAANTQGAQGLFSKDAKFFSGGGNHVLLTLNGDTLAARFQDGSASVLLEFDGIVAGQEYEVAAVFGAGGVSLWVDGVEVASDALVTDWRDNVEWIQWGGRGWASGTGEQGFDAPFNGTLSDRQIFGEALTAAQIAALAGDTGTTNMPPIVLDDAAQTSEDTPLVLPVADLIANDSDPDGGTPAISGIASQPSNGTATFDAIAGTLTYTPDPDFAGQDSLTVTVSDGQGGTAQSTLAITVTPVNDAPSVSAEVQAVASENDTAPLVVDLLEGASDPEADPLAITGLQLVSGDTRGIVVNGATLEVNPAAYSDLGGGENRGNRLQLHDR